MKRLAVFTILLFTLEILVRFSLPIINNRIPTFYYRNYVERLLVDDSKLGWSGRPNANRVLENPLGEKIQYKLDSNGWRHENFHCGGWLILGDSLTFGLGVSNSARYIEQWKRNYPKEDFWDFAHMGYAPDIYYILLTELLPKCQWKGVILQLSNNDVWDISRHRWQGDPPISLKILHGGSSFSGASQLWEFGRYFFQLFAASRDHTTEYEDGLRRLISVVGASVDLVQKEKIRFLLFQATDWGEGAYGVSVATEYRKGIRALAKEKDILFLEVHGNLTPEDFLPYPDLHWNEKGHRKVADAISNFIKF